MKHSTLVVFAISPWVLILIVLIVWLSGGFAPRLGDGAPTAPAVAALPATATLAPPTATPAPSATPAPTATPTAAPTQTSEPTATAIAPTAPPQPVVAADPFVDDAFQSGGLGVSRAFWEERYGPPTDDIPGFQAYQQRAFQVQYRDERIAHIEYGWRDAPVPLGGAQSVAQRLLPRDSVLRRTYASRSGNRVEQYHSETLEARFTDDEGVLSPWLGGDIGDCIVIYRASDDGLVTSIVVAIGNNP